MSQLGDALTDPALDPPVKALVVWSSNPAPIAPDQERVLAGLRRDDLFTVVLEQFMTDTARYADVILPATTQLEHLDVVFCWGHHYLTLNEPAIAPLGEAKPNTEAFRLLAARLGFDDPLLRETDEELLARLLEGDPAGLNLAELRERGWQKIDLGQGATPHAEGGFVTPTGKLGLRAEWLVDAEVDPLPFYDPPAEVADAELAETFPLALLTPKTHLFLNSTFANQERQHSAQPSPYVVVHPDDAAARGIDDGDSVRVFNDRGSFALEARRLRRRPARRRRRPDGLVERRLPRRAQQPGDDLAAAHPARCGPDVQRQPGRSRAAASVRQRRTGRGRLGCRAWISKRRRSMTASNGPARSAAPSSATRRSKLPARPAGRFCVPSTPTRSYPSQSTKPLLATRSAATQAPSRGGRHRLAGRGWLRAQRARIHSSRNGSAIR